MTKSERRYEPFDRSFVIRVLDLPLSFVIRASSFYRRIQKDTRRHAQFKDATPRPFQDLRARRLVPTRRRRFRRDAGWVCLHDACARCAKTALYRERFPGTIRATDKSPASQKA